MDAYLGWILDRLEEKKLREDTLVIFLSDHGEQFFEHGFWTHGRTVYQEEITVPTLISLPGVIPAGGTPRVHTDRVSSPTIYTITTPTAARLLTCGRRIRSRDMRYNSRSLCKRPKTLP